jgi:hypothetical protein
MSLYGSAYLAAHVFVNDGTAASTSSNQSSIKVLLFMALFSLICTATSLLLISYGPACNGVYLGQTPYCSRADTAGWLSVWCAVLSLLPCVTTTCCHLSYHYSPTCRGWMQNRRNRWGRRTLQRSWTILQQSILLGTTTLIVILQCVNVAVVSLPYGGPGREVGSGFIMSWVAWMVSLMLWKNSCFEFVYLISSPSLP